MTFYIQALSFELRKERLSGVLRKDLRKGGSKKLQQPCGYGRAKGIEVTPKLFSKSVKQGHRIVEGYATMGRERRKKMHSTDETRKRRRDKARSFAERGTKLSKIQALSQDGKAMQQNETSSKEVI